MAKLPKVCMICHTKINRDARVIRSARALLEAGYELHLVCLRNDSEHEMPAGLDSARLYQIKAPTGFLAVLKLVQALFLLKASWHGLRIRPAIVHCHDLNVLPAGVLVKTIHKSILIYDSHEIFTEKVAAKRLKWFWEILERRLIRHCRLVITTTEARADFIKNLYPEINLPLVIHNYPDSEVGEPLDIRDAAGLPPDTFVAIYQGGIQPHRGLEQIIEAARFTEGIYFVIQGDGPEFERIRELARNSPKSKYISVLPGMPYYELQRYTASANIGLQLLQPISINHTTTLSNKLFEYLQAGLPVVAADFPMISSIVNEYNVGILVDPTNPQKIGETLLVLKQDPSKQQYLSSSALKAGQILSWRFERSLLIQTYQELPL